MIVVSDALFHRKLAPKRQYDSTAMNFVDNGGVVEYEQLFVDPITTDRIYVMVSTIDSL